MPSKIRLADESGLPWYVYKDPSDPVWTALARAEQQGHVVEDMTLPDELPRQAVLKEPEWGTVVELWQTQGDSPEFRRALSVQTLRRVITNG